VFVILLLLCSNYYCKLAAKTAVATKTTVATKVDAAMATKLAMSTSQDDASRITALQSRLDSLTSTLSSLTGSRTGSDGTNLMNYMYKEAVIYQDIFNAYNSNIIQKVGTPSGWDDTSYATNPWNLRRILRIGGGVQSNGNGMLVNIPSGYNVLWIRILNDRWTTFRVQPRRDDNTVDFSDQIEIYAGGFRLLNEISPDGAGPDSQWDVNKWMPIPIRAAGKYIIYSAQNSDSWISGIAFGKNIWNHAMNSAVAFLWALNPQTGNIGWVGQNWNNDQLAYFPAGQVVEVSVPVIWTGGDKIIYIAEHNNNWVGTMHGNVFINGHAVERFRTSYSNPFATHFNSKFYMRYMATRIPAALIQQGDKFVLLKIDMTIANNNIHFREIGTHDYI